MTNRLSLTLALTPTLTLTLALALTLTLASPASAQTDTARATRLDAVVVTADRITSSIASATAAVSRLDDRDLRSHPLRTVADALRLVPGTALVDFDGLGFDPQIMLRGFYGGGEAEYVLLLLDGRPINRFEDGRATWDQIPLSAIESVEIVRGGSSAAWGDAALAGVINLRTRKGSAHFSSGSIEGGSFGELRASAASVTTWRGRPLSLFGSFTSAEGFRDHSERTTGGFGITVGVVQRETWQLSLSTSHDWRDTQEPGPLPGAELEESRRRSAPFYRFDVNGERTHRASLDLNSTLAGGERFFSQLTAEYRRGDRVRTLELSPEFADTKERVHGATRVGLSAQLELDGVLLPGGDNLLLGIDASSGSLRSKYFAVMFGGPSDYEAADAATSRGDLDARGEGSRSALAGFFAYGLGITETLHLTAGARLDWLRDEFDAIAPSDPASHSATHGAVSPKFGLNWNYSAVPARSGHLYLNIGRSFKAPTLDQLFDQRNIPVPFPPFAITFANDALNPQYAMNYELGFYHSVAISRESLSADITLSAYQMDLKDELDFDIATFRYQNVGRSRHRGIESGVTLHGPHSLRVFTNYTLQSVTSRSGDNSGKYLKAIPRHSVSAGAGIGGGDGLAGSIALTSASGMFLDDANESRLPNWSRWDVRASYSVAGARVFADVINVLDKKYSTTGFPDPSGTGAVYYYPAATRSLRIGISR